MEQIELHAQERKIIGKKVKRLRKQGLVPAIIYGSEIDPLPIQVDQQELVSVLRRAGANRLISIKLDGRSHLALAREVQRDIITRDVLHVDFQQVVMTETITSEVPLHLEGIPPLAAQGEAVVRQVLNAIEVEALPADLIPSITIDIRGLEEIDDAIYVGDLELSQRVKILTGPDEMIVRLSHPELEREEGEATATAEEVEIEAVSEAVEEERK